MSDSDSSNSSKGIRYKTDSTRETSGRNYEKEIIGPALPPHLLVKKEESPQTIGPALPPHLAQKSNDQSAQIGPALPPHLALKKSDTPTRDDDKNDRAIGPQLPPHLIKKDKDNNGQVSKDSPSSPDYVGPRSPAHLLSTSKQEKEPEETTSKPTSFGPQLPPGMSNKSNDAQEGGVKIVGPTLPPHLRKHLEEQAQKESDDISEESDEDYYGPMPAGVAKNSRTAIALEERALQMQIEQLQGPENDVPVRESWMIELPAAKAANLGLGPRQFRNRAAPDMSDRSSWTDIPGEKGKQKDKEKKIDLKAEAELRELEKRDKEQEKIIKKHKRKSKSLVEMHQEKIKKKDEGAGPAERRPFSRDIDLQVNRFDEAQKKAILKKAQLLDDRFSSGQSKFL